MKCPKGVKVYSKGKKFSEGDEVPESLVDLKTFEKKAKETKPKANKPKENKNG